MRVSSSRVSLFLVWFVGLPVLLFSLITWQVVSHGPLLGVDRDVSDALLHPDRGSELLADLGNVQVAVPVLAAVLGYAAWRGRAAGRDRWWSVPLGAAGLMLLFPEDGGEQAPPVGAVVLEERRPAASPEAVSTPGSTRRPVNALAPFRG